MNDILFGNNNSKVITKLSKLAISLTPDASNSANDLLKANPRIIATGLKTSADYIWKTGLSVILRGHKTS